MKQLLTEQAIDDITTCLSLDADHAVALAQQAMAAWETGHTLAELKGLAGEDLAALYKVALTLAEDSRWDKAAPIALQLALHAPGEARFSFLAGTCLQRLGDFRHALGMFGASLFVEQMPVTVFRLGECLAASGEREQAHRAFHETVELCRGNDDWRELQDRAARACVQYGPAN